MLNLAKQWLQTTNDHFKSLVITPFVAPHPVHYALQHGRHSNFEFFAKDFFSEYRVYFSKGSRVYYIKPNVTVINSVNLESQLDIKGNLDYN